MKLTPTQHLYAELWIPDTASRHKWMVKRFAIRLSYVSDKRLYQKTQDLRIIAVNWTNRGILQPVQASSWQISRQSWRLQNVFIYQITTTSTTWSTLTQQRQLHHAGLQSNPTKWATQPAWKSATKFTTFAMWHTNFYYSRSSTTLVLGKTRSLIIWPPETIPTDHNSAAFYRH